MKVYLQGFGRYVPDRIVTNAELASRVDRDAEWIEKASGIHERRWADAETTVADLSIKAAQDCLRKTSVATSEIGLLLVASGSAFAAKAFPGPAAAVAERLGLGSTPAIDLPIASAGSIFGLSLAMQLTPTYGTVLVVAAEKMSELIAGRDGSLDPNTGILFGDGAGAALISSKPGRWRMLDAVLHSDGAYRDDLTYSRDAEGLGQLRMNGLAVILQASRKLPSVIQEVLLRQNIEAAQVGTLLIHQANLNLLMRVVKALNVAPEKVFTNVERYGNTSSASLFIAASEWSETEAAANDAPVVFAGFGAGFHWGAAVVVPNKSDLAQRLLDIGGECAALPVLEKNRSR